jgi:protocatechuate 4,5-dioxygenase alpha subunit
MRVPEAGKFDPKFACLGYALNKMCHTLNEASARADFAADEAGYCARYGLDDVTRDAVVSRDKQRLFALGGNMYFLAKLDRVKKG